LVTQGLFVFLALVFVVCVCLSYRTLKSVQNISPQIDKEVKSIRIFFTAVMIIFVLRGVFDLAFVLLLKNKV